MHDTGEREFKAPWYRLSIHVYIGAQFFFNDAHAARLSFSQKNAKISDIWQLYVGTGSPC
jgi:hypothetical protein